MGLGALDRVWVGGLREEDGAMALSYIFAIYSHGQVSEAAKG